MLAVELGAMGGSSDMVLAEVEGVELVDELRGRAAAWRSGAARASRLGIGIDVSREKSLRMLCIASHPDKTSSPSPTVCFTMFRILI